MIRLYDYLPSGNGYKVRLLLTQLSIPFERIELDIVKGAARTPEFLAKNPNGRIPLIELDDGQLLSESNAILFYFGDGTSLVPGDRFERAQALQWMFFEQYNHEPNIATVRFWLQHLGLDEERKRLVEPKRRLGYEALGVMERGLRDHAYLVADRYSIADIALYAYTHVADEGGFDLERFPAIRAWLRRVRTQPRHIPITQG
ncbi:MAG: glutathione S-transferase family protein [Candidatus Binatia bacterium]